MDHHQRGILLGEFECCRFRNKTVSKIYQYYGFLVFIDLPLIMIPLTQLPDWTEDPIFYYAFIFVLVLDILTLLFLDNLVSTWVSPIRIYSQGIERTRTIWDRIKKRDPFYPFSDIDNVKLVIYDRLDSHNRSTGKGLNLDLMLKSGTGKSLGDRGFQNLEKIQELLNKNGRIPVSVQVGYGPYSKNTSDVNVQSHGARKVPMYVAAPSSTNNKFCIQCGAKIENGSKYCGFCGGKQE